MQRVLGIDPGSGSYDLCGLEDGKVFLDASIPTVEIAQNPEKLVDAVKACGRLDAAVVPSGYGLPLARVADLTDADFFYLSLTQPEDHVKIPELQVSYKRILNSFKEMGLNGYVLPGVVHLDTVPKYRKANRIDLGTPDKVCSAALALHDQASRLGIDYAESSFILLELGFAYTAALAVDAGRVVDGIGGTSGSPGFLAMGGMDGELAYLLGGFGKDLLFEGGVASIAGSPDLTAQQLVDGSARNGRLQLALTCYLEGLRKSVLALKASVREPREVLLSGRLSHVQSLAGKVTEILEDQGEVRVVERIAPKSKESAQGAALLADGIAGGRFSKLLETMRIRQASGTVLDHIYLPNFKQTLLAKHLSST
jgi:predicted butyrate kinase (DUF1464 family)